MSQAPASENGLPPSLGSWYWVSEPGRSRASGKDSLPLSLARSLDEVCCRFEAAYRAGSRPRIEEYVGEQPGPQHAALVRELVLLDVHYRRLAGEEAQVADYLGRFPDLDSGWLIEAIAPQATVAPAFPLVPPDQAPGPLPAGLVAEAKRVQCPHCHNPIRVVDDHHKEVLCPGCGSSFRLHEVQTIIQGNTSERLGKFQLLERVGAGAFGAVWRVRDTELDRLVALKMPHQGLINSAGDLERFHREARAAAQLRHPGIVTVHEVTTLAGLPAIVADFIEGVTLRDLLQIRRLTFCEAAAVVADVAEAIDYAHSRGLIHRDIKPANIMVEHGQPGEDGTPAAVGRPLVTDFGLALRDEVEITVTLDGQILGTPAYMSPEQAAGQSHAVDARSDVYSIGVVLYEMLCGALPFHGSKVMLLHQMLHEEPRPPRRINDRIPRDLETICLQAMAKSPARRYASAQALADDLRCWLKGEPIRARSFSAVERGVLWARRRPLVAALLGGIVVTTALGFGGVTWQLLQTLQALAAVREAKAGEAEAEVREAQERWAKEEEHKNAEQHQRAEQAHRDVKQFYRLADEVQFYAASTNPVAERAPYFDPRKAEAVGKAALALARTWGPGLEKLALPEEQPLLRQEVHDLLLLLAHLRLQQPGGPETASPVLALLEEARPLGGLSRSYHRLRARCYRQLGDPKGAGEEERLADAPSTPATALDHFLLAEEHRTEAVQTAGDQPDRALWQPSRELLTKAVAQYQQAVQAKPNHPWSHFQLGRCYLSLGDGAHAVGSLGAFVALRPDSPWGYSARGFVLAQMRKFPEAERDLEQALRLSPGFRPALLNRGFVRRMQERYAEALADFDAVLQPPAEQQLIEAAYYRGQVYLKTRRYAEALTDFDRVAADNPGFRAVYSCRAELHLLRGQEAEALDAFDAYLAGGRSYASRSPEAHAQRGGQLCYLVPLLDVPPAARRKQLELALGELQRAADLGSRSPGLFNDLGKVNEYLGRGDEAIRAYSRGLEHTPDDARLLVNRGWALEKLQRYDLAETDFARAAKVDSPFTAEACTGLGYLRAGANAPADAQRHAARALLQGAGDYLVLHNVACIYGRLSQTDADRATGYQDTAVVLLRRAVELRQWGGAGPSEIELIKAEPAFPQALRDREDFRKLITAANH